MSWGGIAFALPDTAALSSIPDIPPKNLRKFSENKIVEVAEVNQLRCCLEEWTAKA